LSNRRALSPAWVLHRRDYGDSSLLVELFSLQHGRIGCIAKGAKSGKSPKAIHLQPFNPLLIDLSGRNDLKSLVVSEPSGLPLKLQGQNLYAGFYLNELLMQFLPRLEPMQSTFAWYGELLNQLVENEFAFESALRMFEKHLLDELGLGLELNRDAETGCRIESDQLYLYLPEQGPVKLKSEFDKTSEYPVVCGGSLLALQQGNIENASHLRECKLLMRFIISRHLNGYRFRSRELFAKNSKLEIKP